MAAQVINLFGSTKTPRYRPLPTEPAAVLILPSPASPKFNARPNELEAKMREKYKLDAVDRVGDKPCDT